MIEVNIVVYRQLTSVFTRLKAHVDRAKDELRDDIRALNKETEGLQESTNKAKLLR